MNRLLDYQCHVFESGYKFILGGEVVPIEKKIENIYLIPIDPQSPRRVFNLMDHDGAYLEFATIFIELYKQMIIKMIQEIEKEEGYQSVETNKNKETQSLARKFVNKYGMLTSNTHEESYKTWMDNGLTMASVVTTLRHLRSNDRTLLENIFIKKGDKFVYAMWDEISSIKTEHKSVDIPTVGQSHPRNYIEAAYHYICHNVNFFLKDSLVTEVIVNPTNTGTDMIVRPKDLLSGLWLQLAHSVSKNLEFKQCAECSSFFEVKSKKRKNERVYCSERCRVRVGARNRRAKEKAEKEKQS